MKSPINPFSWQVSGSVHNTQKKILFTSSFEKGKEYTKRKEKKMNRTFIVHLLLVLTSTLAFKLNTVQIQSSEPSFTAAWWYKSENVCLENECVVPLGFSNGVMSSDCTSLPRQLSSYTDTTGGYLLSSGSSCAVTCNSGFSAVGGQTNFVCHEGVRSVRARSARI